MPPTLGHFLGTSPVLLSSSCDVLANNSAVPDSGQLTYPFRKAIWIDEIRWGLRGSSGSANSLGALVYTKLSLGRHFLMRDACPIWLLSTVMSQVEEAQMTTIEATITPVSQYRWRLPEPLYVGPGEVLQSSFSRGNDSLGSFNVQVSYAGRTAAPNQAAPRVIPIPYAGRFVTTLGNTYQQSNENHLINPFDKPLRVQRLTGRVLARNAIGPVYSMVRRLTPSTAGSAITIQMDDSWGGKMVNEKTGPSDVFDCVRGAWTVDTMMPAKGVYMVQAWDMAATDQLHVGLIGVREERP